MGLEGEPTINKVTHKFHKNLPLSPLLPAIFALLLTLLYLVSQHPYSSLWRETPPFTFYRYLFQNYSISFKLNCPCCEGRPYIFAKFFLLKYNNQFIPALKIHKAKVLRFKDKKTEKKQNTSKIIFGQNIQKL